MGAIDRGHDRADRIAREILPRLPEILGHYFPLGFIKGNRFHIGSVAGEAGNSLTVDLKDGKWTDFHSNEKGGSSIISLINRHLNISFKEAMDMLCEDFGIDDGTPKIEKAPGIDKKKILEFDLEGNPFILRPFERVTCYKDAKGRPAQYIFELKRDASGKKIFWPYTRHSLGSGKAPIFVMGKKDQSGTVKNYLYRMDEFKKFSLIFIVEGEKCARALQAIFNTNKDNDVLVTTWPGGSGNVRKQSFFGMKGKRVYLWPDNDAAGREAMRYVLSSLIKVGAREIKIIDMQKFKDKKDGWDCADAIKEGLFKDNDSCRAFVRGNFVSVNKSEIEESKSAPPVTNEGGGDQYSNVVPITGKQEDLNLDFHSPVKSAQFLMRLKVRFNEVRQTIKKDVENYKIMVLYLAKKNHIEVWHDEISRLEYVVINYRYTMGQGYEAKKLDSHPRPVGKETAVDIRIMLEQMFPGVGDFDEGNIQSALRHVANMFPNRSGYRDFFLSLPEWDGVPRMEKLFTDYAKSEDNELNRSMGKILMMALTRRALADKNCPGIAFHYMPIIYGKQGTGKTHFLQVLGGKFFYTEMDLNLRDKDCLLRISSNLLIEAGEFDPSSSRNLKALKAFLTQEVDSYRPPYGAKTLTVLRRAVIVATTDMPVSYNDPAGNRRFITIEVREVDIAKLKRDRDQIWAEAYSMYKENENYPLFLADDALKEAVTDEKGREESNPMEEEVADFLTERLKNWYIDEKISKSGKMEGGDRYHSPKYVWFTTTEFLNAVLKSNASEKRISWRMYVPFYKKFGCQGGRFRWGAKVDDNNGRLGGARSQKSLWYVTPEKLRETLGFTDDDEQEQQDRTARGGDQDSFSF